MTDRSWRASTFDTGRFVRDIRRALVQEVEMSPEWRHRHAVWVTHVELVEDRGDDFSIRLSLVDTRTNESEEVVINDVRYLADIYHAFDGQEFAEHVLSDMDEERTSVPPSCE